MGGGSSRLNVAEGEVVPVKIRPLLLRRFEELRKRRNGGTLQIEGTLSKKQLLKDGEEVDSNSQSSREIETEIQNKEKEPANEDIMVVQVISIEKLSRVVPLPHSECKCKTEGEKEEEEEEKDPNTEQDNQEKVSRVDEEKVFHVDKVTEVEEEKTRENEQEVDAYAKGDHDDDHDHDHDDDNDNDDGESEEYGRLVCPGSPSFRIYCIEAERRKEEEEEESKDQIVAMHKKSRSADSVASVASRNSRNSNEVIQIVEIESTQKKKGHKIKKFGGVKTLLKVKSCYHPMSSCAGNDRSRLLAAKATN